MNQPVVSLSLPDYLLQKLRGKGYFCSDDLEEHYEEARKVCKTQTAFDLYQEEVARGCVRTLCGDLDEALGGGLFLGQITEFCGEPGSGKTNLCFQLCISLQCEKPTAKAFYMYTNKGFASHRLKEIALAMQKDCDLLTRDVDQILKNVTCVAVSNYVELIAAVRHLRMFLKTNCDVRLVVIDSISAPLKEVSYTFRTQIVYDILKELQVLSEEYGFAILLTNNMTTQSNEGIPSLGGSYYHRINARVQLEKIGLNLFKASVVKNVFKQNSEILFQVVS